ncbi:MAG: hypothetical protein ABH843_02930 [Candidatus Omnitrophota bacterium]
MKPIILYICFAGLIILILVNMWAAKESRKNQLVLEEKIESLQIAPQAQKTSLDYDYETEVPITPDEGSAITIIKQPEPVRYESDEIQESTVSSDVNSAVSQQDAEAAADEFDSGVDEINKYPSKTEIKEMKDRGVVAL